MNWVEYGEKNSKFFLNLEKRNYNMKCITKLLEGENGTEINNPDDILKYEQMFYKKLYSESSEDIENETEFELFRDENLPKINEESKESCESDITIKEIGIALKE
jgi:hypothetical protein